MKRALRWLLVGAGVVVLLLGLAVAALLSSSLQTRFIRKALVASDPKAQLEGASLGWSGGALWGLNLTAGGHKISIEHATVAYSLPNLLFGSVRTIDHLSIKGLQLEIAGAPKAASGAKQPSPPQSSTAAANAPESKPATASAPAPAPSQPAATAGGAGTAFLVKELDIEATVALPDQRSIAANFTAHDLGAGGQGQAQGQLRFRDDSAGAAVPAIQVDTTLALACDAKMALQTLTLSANLAATVSGQSQPAQLQIQIQAGAPQNGAHPFSLSLIQPGGAAPASLFTAQGTLAADGGIAGDFSANATSAQIAPFAFGEKLPDLDLRGGGKFTSDSRQDKGSMQATLDVSANHLGALPVKLSAAAQSGLEAMGAVQAHAGVDFAWAGQTGEAKTFTLQFGPQNAKPAISVELLKAAGFEFSSGTARLTEGAAPELLRLTVSDVPTAWLNSALPANCTLSGGNSSAEVVLGARADGTLAAQTTQPWVLNNFNLTRDGQPCLQGASLQLDAAAEYKDGAIQTEVRRLLLTAGSESLGQLTANVAFAPAGAPAQTRLAGHLAVAIDQWARQPFAKAWAANLPAGPLRFDATFDLAQTAAGFEAEALELALAQEGAPLFTLKLSQKINLPPWPWSGPPAVTGDLAVLEASGLPLALLAPLLPAGTEIGGGPLQGRLVVAGGNGGWVWRTDEPLALEHFGLARNRQPALADAALTLTTTGAWNAQGIQGAAHLQAGAAAGIFLDGNFQASQAADKKLTVTLSMAGDVAALGAQPLGAEWRDLLPESQPQYAINAGWVSDGANLTVQSFQAQVTPRTGGPAAAGPLADIKLLQPVTLPPAAPPAKDAAKPAPTTWPALSGDVLAVKFAALPIGVLGLAAPSYHLQGDTVSADLGVHGEGGGVYTVTANTPLNLGNLSVHERAGNAAVVNGLTIAGQPTLRLSSDGLLYFNAPDLALSSGGDNLAKGGLEITLQPGQSLPTQAKLNLTGDVAGLVRQPFLRAYDNLAKGTAAISGELKPEGDFQLDVEFSGWQARGDERVVKQLKISNATGKLGHAAGAWQINAPLRGEGPDGATDCALKLSFTPAGAGHTFDLSLTGNGLVTDDVMTVADSFRPTAAPKPEAAFAPTGEDEAPEEPLPGSPASVAAENSSAPAAASPAASPEGRTRGGQRGGGGGKSGDKNSATAANPAATPSSASATPAAATASTPGAAAPAAGAAAAKPAEPPPFWGAITGGADVNLKRIMMGQLELENARGQAKVTPAQIALGSVSATISGGVLSTNGTIAYAPAKSKAAPYSLSAKLGLANFDAGKFFKKRAPKDRPPVEGKFTIGGTASGQGADLDALVQRAQFDFTLNSNGGTVYILDTVAKKGGNEIKAVSDVAGLAGIVAGLAGQKAPPELKQFNDLVTLLGTITYNKMTFEAKRGADLNINLTKIEARSQDIDLTGSGRITNRAKLPIPSQPLNVNLQLDARGRTATLLSSLNLMNASAAGSTAYAPGPKFPVTGTLQSPNFSGLYNLLYKAAMSGVGKRLLGG